MGEGRLSVNVGGGVGKVIRRFEVDLHATSAVASWCTEVVAMLRIQREKSSNARPKYDHQSPRAEPGPQLLRLPDQVLDEIASEIDFHEDLTNFGLALYACANIVIPRHTQYRIIRVRNASFQLWAHLARRADIARNIREVHMCEQHNYMAPGRLPTTLVDP
ncbi:uncharacterized protein LACBIDRAFT_306700 [Laccaria bicolor S238N-H82]|uniref:Predicted protein n=1 Tax=Laccaria bicolor (strain S238N-H82 / ATCC MYA-4686) TaxID=486041 RepID=B0DNK4_LACBS|nr:uncharacterized protein LACBIDRAFT_306700 [Laccaria bicolor S238N-H82]EDR03958.1 predicted protein [Laccaria bicolor S238N-H82]|eukprot:XP_001885526.1 predicted protein [Laccaria bicolor S238N-H82]